MNKQKGNGFVALMVVMALIWGGISLVSDVATQSKVVVAETATQESNNINAQLRESIPVPQLTTSSERKNVARRAELFNNEDKISYIYFVNYGKVMAFFTVKGKVSSLRSYMTPTEKLVRPNGEDCNSRYSDYCNVVSAPDIDGTWGENVEGIFFFTTEGAYVEWKGEYMMSDQPLKLTTQPELVREIQ